MLKGKFCIIKISLEYFSIVVNNVTLGFFLDIEERMIRKYNSIKTNLSRTVGDYYVWLTRRRIISRWRQFWPHVHIAKEVH